MVYCTIARPIVYVNYIIHTSLYQYKACFNLENEKEFKESCQGHIVHTCYYCLQERNLQQ